MTTRSKQATAKTRRAVVHVREFLADSLTPIAVYRRLEKISPIRFLLESVSGGESPGLHVGDCGDTRIPGVVGGRYRLRISAPRRGVIACEVRARA